MNFQKDYDWQQAFEVSRVDGADRVDIEDVELLLAAVEGEGDGPNWLALFRLKNGKYGTITAGCDYTGWDCQADGVITVGDTTEEVLNFGLDEAARVKLLFNVTPDWRVPRMNYYRHPDLYVTMKASI